MPGSGSLGYMTANVRSNALSTVGMAHVDQRFINPMGIMEMSGGTGGAVSVPKPIKVPVSKRLLTVLNILMALFHAGLAFITFYFGKLDLEGSLWKSEMNFTYTNSTPPWDLIPVYEQLDWGLRLTVVTALFFIISSGFHLGNATLWRSFYFSELEECRAPTRWIEYFFSAAVMMLLLAFGAGIRDVMLLFALSVLIAVTMPYGYWTEVIARPKSMDEWTLPLRSRLLPYLLGHVPQVTAWVIVVASFYDESDLGRIPDFVHIVIWGELVFFFSFGLVQLGQQMSKPQYYQRGEVAYQFLSLISKGLLGGLLLANVLMLSNVNEIYE